MFCSFFVRTVADSQRTQGRLTCLAVPGSAAAAAAAWEFHPAGRSLDKEEFSQPKNQKLVSDGGVLTARDDELGKSRKINL